MATLTQTAVELQTFEPAVSALGAMACGLARSGGEIVAFRAVQGVTYAIITPSSISIISNHIEEGHPRDMAFATMGFSQSLGFCFGLVLGGVFTDTVGWRPAFYLAAAVSGTLFLLAIRALPQDIRPRAGPSIWKRLIQSLSSDIHNIRSIPSIFLLVVAAFSIPLFISWMHYRVKNNRSALIPNSLWRSHVFTSCCVMVLLTSASALKASLRVVPSLVAGGLTSIATGIFVHRMPVSWMLLISSVMSTVGPLLMALVRTRQLYWENAFVAQILSPISCDVLFTVGLLIISDVFPRHTQALGGAVFNTCAQLGGAIGLSVTQFIASSVTGDSSHADKSAPDALLTGYKAAFWAMFGWMMFVCLVCVVGMRRVGVIGVKRD